MSQPINNLFNVMRVINASNEPVTAKAIANKTCLSVGTVRRYANRLYKEGLIEIKTHQRGTARHLSITGEDCAMDNLFKILHLINASAEPLHINDIVEQTNINIRTAQRISIRLVNEGLVMLTHEQDVRGYKYTKKESEK